MNYRSLLAAAVAIVATVAIVNAFDLRQGTQTGQTFGALENAGLNSIFMDVDPLATACAPGTGASNACVADARIARGEVCKLGQLQLTQANSSANSLQNVVNLFAVPANAIPTHARLFYANADNAGTTATLSVGYSSADGLAGTEFLNAINVKSGGAVTQANNISTLTTSTKFFTSNSPTTFTRVSAFLAETGTASTAGGPFVFELCYYTP